MSSKVETGFHAIIRTEQREGIYQVRLYSMRKDYGGDMELHSILLYYVKPTELDERTLESVGEIQAESEDELFQGSPRYGQIALTLRAIPEFLPLVAYMRDPTIDIWCEITLEQHVTDTAPATYDGNFLWPRKKRSIFWGKLDRKEGEGAINKQLLIEGPDTEIKRYAVDHDGTLQLSFMHWLKAFSERSSKEFLDHFLTLHAKGAYGIQIGTFLQALVEWMSPTSVVAVCDHRLRSEEEIAERGCNALWVDFNPHPGTATNELSNWWLPMTGPLFENTDNKPGENSFYQIKTVGELLHRTCDEFFLFPQAEIPILEDIHAISLSNNGPNRREFWPQVTRWLIQSYERAAIPIHVTPLVDTIRYRPSATWASSYKVEQPSADGLLPSPAYSTVYSQNEGGSDKSYKTLFRFPGYIWKDGGQFVSQRGYELLFGADTTNQCVTSVSYNGLSFNSWATFHATLRINRWGNVKSTLEFTSRGVGLEPFGEYATYKGEPADKPKFTFGLRDFGEFPLLRVLKARYGLLPEDDNTLIEYKLLSIGRQPSGNAKLKFIELAELEDTDPDNVVEAPPAKAPETGPPTVNTPNVTPGETLPTVKTVQVTATDTDSGVSQVKLFFNLSTAPPTLVDTLIVPGSDGYYTFSIKSTLYPNGTYTLTAVAIDNAGNYASQTKTVIVNTPP